MTATHLWSLFRIVFFDFFIDRISEIKYVECYYSDIVMTIFPMTICMLTITVLTQTNSYIVNRNLLCILLITHFFTTFRKLGNFSNFFYYIKTNSYYFQSDELGFLYFQFITVQIKKSLFALKTEIIHYLII